VKQTSRDSALSAAEIQRARSGTKQLQRHAKLLSENGILISVAYLWLRVEGRGRRVLIESKMLWVVDVANLIIFIHGSIEK
jgi:hypothetical protein